MIHHLGTLVVSFLVTNWIYSEIVFFCPQIEPYAIRIAQVLRIPTHNEWPEIAGSKEAQALSKEIDRFVLTTGLKDFFLGLRNSQARVTGDQKPGTNPPLASEQFDAFLASPTPFKSGDDVFCAGKRKYVNGGFKAFEFDRLENVRKRQEF